MPDTQPADVQPKKTSLSWLGKILGVIVFAFAAFAGYVAVQKDDFRVERSLSIAAPPEVVFPLVNDLRAWETWSPWAKLDPNAKNRFEGPDSGVGAKFSWEGNNEVGVGSMLIKESQPPERVLIQLDFEKPMKDTSSSEFVLKPQGDQTVVTWAMYGTYANFMAKAMCTVMNMDKMVGGQFEKGLANLKAAAEVKSSPAAPTSESTPDQQGKE